MRWEGNRQSDNVEDRRAGGGGGGFGFGGKSIGIGTIVIALLAWGVFGINPLTTIGVLGGAGQLLVMPFRVPDVGFLTDDAMTSPLRGVMTK